MSTVIAIGPARRVICSESGATRRTGDAVLGSGAFRYCGGRSGFGRGLHGVSGRGRYGGLLGNEGLVLLLPRRAWRLSHPGLPESDRSRRLTGFNNSRSAAGFGSSWRLAGFGSIQALLAAPVVSALSASDSIGCLAGFGRGRLRLRRGGSAVRSLVPLDEIPAGHRENSLRRKRLRRSACTRRVAARHRIIAAGDPTTGQRQRCSSPTETG